MKLSIVASMEGTFHGCMKVKCVCNKTLGMACMLSINENCMIPFEKMALAIALNIRALCN